MSVDRVTVLQCIKWLLFLGTNNVFYHLHSSGLIVSAFLHDVYLKNPKTKLLILQVTLSTAKIFPVLSGAFTRHRLKPCASINYCEPTLNIVNQSH